MSQVGFPISDRNVVRGDELYQLEDPVSHNCFPLLIAQTLKKAHKHFKCKAF